MSLPEFQWRLVHRGLLIALMIYCNRQKLHRSPGFMELRQWGCWQIIGFPQGTELTTIEEAVLDPLVQLFPVLISFQQITTVTSPPRPRLVTISLRKSSSKRTSTQSMTLETLDVADPGDNSAGPDQSVIVQRLGGRDIPFTSLFR